MIRRSVDTYVAYKSKHLRISSMNTDTYIDTYVALFYDVRGMMSISMYVHMIIVVKIEGEDEHSKVLVLFKGAP